MLALYSQYIGKCFSNTRLDSFVDKESRISNDITGLKSMFHVQITFESDAFNCRVLIRRGVETSSLKFHAI